jgi:hypothetical protein
MGIMLLDGPEYRSHEVLIAQGRTFFAGGIWSLGGDLLGIPTARWFCM